MRPMALSEAMLDGALDKGHRHVIWAGRLVSEDGELRHQPKWLAPDDAFPLVCLWSRIRERKHDVFGSLGTMARFKTHTLGTQSSCQ